MNIIEFIKSKLSEETQIGDLAKDIQGDKDFPFDKTEDEIISYLNFKTNSGGTNLTFEKLLHEYNSKKDLKDKNVHAKKVTQPLLRSEKWIFLKENFPIDSVILVGSQSDYYKVYCVDKKKGRALYFNIKSNNNLNDISELDEEKIYIGNLTERVSVETAIKLLENCSYETADKPYKENFDELLSFLKANI